LPAEARRSVAITGAPDMNCSMIAPRIAGFKCCQSGPSLVTVMKS
jgi:hypothetical protein